MFEHDLEKIGSAFSKHSANLRSSGFSAKNLAENPQKTRNRSYLDMWGGKQLLSVGSTKRMHSQIRCVFSAEYFTHISCLVVMSIGYCPLRNSTTNSPQSCTGRAMMVFDDKGASDESWVSVITDPEVQSDILCNNRRLFLDQNYTILQ